jgi:hypothetical protein
VFEAGNRKVTDVDSHSFGNRYVETLAIHCLRLQPGDLDERVSRSTAVALPSC